MFSHLGYGQEFSEICPSNHGVYEDPNEGFADWVEIHNNQGTSIDLEEYSISDSISNPKKWTFGSILIPSDGYYLLMSNEESNLNSTLTISLPKKGITLYLFDQNQSLVDSIVQPELHTNHSYGRVGSEFFFFDQPTPGVQNSTLAYKGYAISPGCSSGSGVVNSTVISLFTVPGQSIFYSLNGLEPQLSNLYSGPITINKTTSLSAVTVGDSLLPSEKIFRIFYKNVKHELSVVHLTIDSLAMFDTIVGIYMPGPNASQTFPYYGANFWKDTAIDVHYAYFNEELVLQEELNCELKIHGGTISTTQPLRSFRLVARDRFEKEAFKYPYFPNKNVIHFRRLLLRNSGSDYNYTHLKDGILHSFCADHGMNVDVQGYVPVVVYINGNYWGVMNLREKIDEYYPETNYFVSPDSVNMLEENNLKQIAGDSISFTDLLNYVDGHDMNDQNYFEIVSEKVDIYSLVDYFVMETFVNNRDWPYNNLKVWNSKDGQTKWRYLLSDLDAGIKYYGDTPFDFYHLETIFGPWGDLSIHVQLMKNLLKNYEYKRYFVNRYADLLNTIYQADYILDYIYKGKEKIGPEMEQHFQHWWAGDWEENFKVYDLFFEDRVEIVREDIKRTFQVGENVSMFFSVYPSNAATILLNSIQLDSFPFKGQYYNSNAIDLGVEAKEGREFKYWVNLTTGEKFNQSKLLWSPNESDSLVAVFETIGEVYELSLYPNPSYSYTTIVFSLPATMNCTFRITNLKGVLIDEFPQGILPMGTHKRWLETSHLQYGSYFVTIVTNKGWESTKLVVIR